MVNQGRPIAIGGTKQRATLGFLLLNANRVVATSHLLNALWPMEETPATARKILQNAVWGLRTVLSSAELAGSSATLVTRAPGYILSVDPHEVDLHSFHLRVEEGRAKLAAAEYEAAASILREAIGLWRGPVLADLVETGVCWPELTMAEGARLDTMEDYFEAELACGRHQHILSDLEAMVEQDVLRERACGQLMLALYRCGRQADALNVYTRVRAALVENLGLEPGPALQALQQAILAHQPDLTLAGTPTTVHASLASGAVLLRDPLRDKEADTEHDDRSPRPGTLDVQSSYDADGGELLPFDRNRRPAAARPAPAGPQRRRASAVLIRTQVCGRIIGVDPADVDQLFEDAAAAIREEVERLGGVLVAWTGPVSLAIFGIHPDDSDAERAVEAALVVRDRLDRQVSTSQNSWPEPSLSVQVAVATGDLLVREVPGQAGPPSVNGALLGECYCMLDSTPPGAIRVCDRTRGATEGVITYSATAVRSKNSHSRVGMRR